MKVIVDTDTASDDAVALLLAVLSDRIDVEAVTVVAGNVSFDDQVENAKYTLSLADATDVPVYEGARDPPSSTSADAAPVYRSSAAGAASVSFEDVPVDQGEEVEYHVAGPSTSVYGTDSGTVTGVKSGTDDHNILIVETDSGEHRVREDWVVDDE